MVCPRPVGTVHDLRRSGLAVARGRPRTDANETEMETTRAGRSAGIWWRSTTSGPALLADVPDQARKFRSPDAQGLGPRQLLGFIRATLARPYWLDHVEHGGTGLHAFALHRGALAVVQPLASTGAVGVNDRGP